MDAGRRRLGNGCSRWKWGPRWGAKNGGIPAGSRSCGRCTSRSGASRRSSGAGTSIPTTSSRTRTPRCCGAPGRDPRARAVPAQDDREPRHRRPPARTPRRAHAATDPVAVSSDRRLSERSRRPACGFRRGCARCCTWSRSRGSPIAEAADVVGMSGANARVALMRRAAPVALRVGCGGKQ